MSKYRRQILGIKGKVILTATYSHEKTKRVVEVVSNSASTVLNREIDLKRAIINAGLNGVVLAQRRFFNSASGIYIVNIKDVKIKYDNKNVKVKTFIRKGKRYTGVWLKGKKGIQNVQAVKGSKKINKNDTNKILLDNGVALVNEDTVFNK